MNKATRCCCLLFAVTLVNSRGIAESDDNSLSPDKQWRYELVEGQWPEIHKTSTAQRALDLMGNDRSVPYPNGKEVVWAPDSKRFAFNYSPPHVPHSTYETIAFYQLRGEEWVLLHSPVDEDSSLKSFAELAKHLPKGIRAPHLWRLDPNRVVFKVRDWPDADTAILYVYSAGSTNGGGDSPSAFLFTLKFDAEGKCKIVNAKKAPKEQSED